MDYKIIWSPDALNDIEAIGERSNLAIARSCLETYNNQNTSHGESWTKPSPDKKVRLGNEPYIII